MKRLVKTAKEQFEERMKVLNCGRPMKIGDETFWMCDDDKMNFSLLRLRDDDECKYGEFVFGKPLCEIYEDQDFLAYIFDYWYKCSFKPVKELFDWYASADRDEAPFDVTEIINGHKNDFILYTDIYEEIAMKVITAKEQWENASKNATKMSDCERVEVTDDYIVFYTIYDNYHEATYYPKFQSLREDGKFVAEYIKVVQNTHPLGLKDALEWLGGNVYTMGDCNLYDIKIAYDNAYGKPVKTIQFEDIEEKADEEPVQPIDNTDLNEKANALQLEIISRINHLCDSGKVLDNDKFLKCVGATIGWTDGGYCDCANIECGCLKKDADNGWYFWYKATYDCEYDCELTGFTINTLLDILNCME